MEAEINGVTYINMICKSMTTDEGQNQRLINIMGVWTELRNSGRILQKKMTASFLGAMILEAGIQNISHPILPYFMQMVHLAAFF